VKVAFAHKFISQYKTAPAQKRARFDKQLGFLFKNLRHPSLKAKVYDASRRVWQARVNGSWRFYFQIAGETYYLLSMVRHPK